jgi:hypothetical protein
MSQTNIHPQYFQINAERLKVLAKPLAEDSFDTFQPKSPVPTPVVFDDFALFTSKKRKDDEETDEQAPKKTKTGDGKEDYEMIVAH